MEISIFDKINVSNCAYANDSGLVQINSLPHQFDRKCTGLLQINISCIKTWNLKLILKRNKENSKKFSFALNSNSNPPPYPRLQASITPNSQIMQKFTHPYL
jgi:hypothetical protein